MKKLIVFPLLFLLSACASTFSAPSPATAPTTAELTSEMTAEAALAQLSPIDLWNVGVKLNFERCPAYFNPLAQQAATLKMAGQEAGLAGSATAGALGLAGAGTGGAAIVALLSSLFPQALDAYSNAQTGGLPPGAMFMLVQKSQQQFIANVTPPATIAEALMDVSALAQICGPAQIQALGLQAVLNAQPSATVSVPTAPLALRPGATAPRIRVPPVISVK